MVANLAVIPARGGSKRIPRKNIRIFDGLPMLAWSVRAARDSGLFTDIIVSTDDAEIAEVARAHGASVPFMRPGHLADDHTGTAAVVTHALQWAQSQGLPISHVCCIYATAPFLQASDLRAAFELLQSAGWSYAIAASEFPAPVQRSFTRLDSGGVQMLFPEHRLTRSQDLAQAYHDAGQFYWGTAAAWIENRPGLSSDSCFVAIPRWRVQDIDTPQDWACAELLAPAIRQRLAEEAMP